MKKQGSMDKKKEIRLADRISVSLPSAVMFIGLMLMAMAQPAGEYLLGAGVALQLALLAFKVPKLFR